MHKSNPLVFFGTEYFSEQILRALVENGWKIELAITKPDRLKGRGRKSTPTKVKQLALEHDIPHIEPVNFDSATLATIDQLESQTAVLASYGKILPSNVLASFKNGIINIHPSLLPKYRGPSPIESAILNGESQTGVTIIRLIDKMDAGPIYASQTLALKGDETQSQLTNKLADIGANLLLETLPNIINGKLSPKPQNEDLATYCKLIKKSDGLINWKLPAKVIERQIRAFHDWPKSRTKLFDTDVIITSATIVPVSGKPGKVEINHSRILVYCSIDALSIEELKPVGKNVMSAKDYINGLKTKKPRWPLTAPDP